ncbi:SCP2 sterol-binding domain-containing protein [Micromonospora globbae]|mgnify:CR=1 FL=1|uniref:SCP2 sterol-binding domain-containing protein n=1 Tax=Micromonospora globbae TaxID=1894969 RepID=A0A420EWX1_9ACTN|nr:SCP2 sterol-binding domain-containing protein [Micromonospora globbae]RKF25221.1 sterol-binding protein [Micromonospora globbae]WTF85202.1 SCP2 sterol-binding domain-containing protein [Micromonospora globbae]
MDATTRFFEEIDRRGYEPRLAKTTGSLRIDLQEGPRTMHWFLKIDHGRIEVSQQNQEADTVVGTSPQLFEEIASGREHGIAAILRGDMTVSGDARLLVQVERIFPGNPDARGPRRRFQQEVR